MTKALIVIFHRSPPFWGDNYHMLLDYFKKEVAIWGGEIDKIYFIDSNEFLYTGEEKGWQFPCKVEIFHTKNLSHADNLSLVVPQVEEDFLLIIDSDTIIVKPRKISSYMGMLIKHDVVSMIERPQDNMISRFSPYFCFIRTKALKKINPLRFDPEPPIHLDPLAKLTHQLLEKGITYCELKDDRSTIQMTKDGIILRTPNMPLDTGYYHLRNFNGSINLIDSYNADRQNYERSIRLMPPTEITRLLGWLWCINKSTIKSEKIYRDILSVLNDIKISKELWFPFIDEFKTYHSYMFI